jgi:hypothetical protein
MAGGAVHDPLAALVFCRPPDADFAIVNGNVRRERNAFIDLDIDALVATQNRIARALLLP